MKQILYQENLRSVADTASVSQNNRKTYKKKSDIFEVARFCIANGGGNLEQQVGTLNMAT
jgi:hypothetical protein